MTRRVARPVSARKSGASQVKTEGAAWAMLQAMSYDELDRRILAFIDVRLWSPLSLAAIAAESGLSIYHFSRLFTALHGQSVMAFVRARRLSAAARRLLAEPRLSLIDLAFDCGFESQQAFTRAFRRAFGVAPGRFRKLHVYVATHGDPVMTQPVSFGDRLNRIGDLQHRPAFTVAGCAGRFDNQTKSAIPRLWGQLVPRLPLSGQKGGEGFGVCWAVDPDKGFNYMAGVELSPGAATPEGLETVEIPAQDYAVFRLTLTGGELHPQMSGAAAEIWGQRLQAAGLKPSGGPDFELYPDDFDQHRPGAWVEYWVPVAT